MMIAALPVVQTMEIVLKGYALGAEPINLAIVKHQPMVGVMLILQEHAFQEHLLIPIRLIHQKRLGHVMESMEGLIPTVVQRQPFVQILI